MQFKSVAMVRGMKKLDTEIEGKLYDFTKVYIDMEFDESKGLARGISTEEFEFGRHDEFDKLVSVQLPFQAEVTFEFNTTGSRKTQKVIALTPIRSQVNASAKAPA